MFQTKGIKAIRRLPRRLPGRAVLPWIFVLGVAAGTALPLRSWVGLAPPATDRQLDEVWRQAGAPEARHRVEVLRPIDGDTFEARVDLWPGLTTVTRVRLRGIDAPELNGACVEEHRLAAAAANALRRLLGEGGVIIFNVGPDKYAGRVVADVATRRTANVSEALLVGGFARSYHGGRRTGWCAGATR